MNNPLILSLFPGVGLLDMAFEAEGFCVVRGPDLLWGGDIRRLHPPEGRFDGVIGGPPCQAFSRYVHMVRANGFTPAENLIPEFERVVWEAQPVWFLMENVEGAPLPSVTSYAVHAQMVNNRWCGGVQNRERRFSFGTRDGRALVIRDWAALEPPEWQPAVAAHAGGRRRPIKLGGSGKPKSGNAERAMSFQEMLRLQGLSDGFLSDAPFTATGKAAAVGNGVPLPMGRAVARAVRRALGLPILEAA